MEDVKVNVSLDEIIAKQVVEIERLTLIATEWRRRALELDAQVNKPPLEIQSNPE